MILNFHLKSLLLQRTGGHDRQSDVRMFRFVCFLQNSEIGAHRYRNIYNPFIVPALLVSILYIQ